MIYFIADTHFSHFNIIKYCNRPFEDIEEMNERMIKNWNDIVKPNDIVYHLGDFTLDTDIITNLVSSLNGKIYFVRGNHDGKSIKFYNGVGLEVIPTQTKLEDYSIILSHRPLRDDQIPNGYINVHGHIHNSKLDVENFSRELHRCVSVEMINYTPISVTDIAP